jgi:O-antigen ligase
MKQLITHKIFYVFLGVFMASFVMPSYGFNTQLLISVLAFGLLFVDSFSSKLSNLKTHKKTILILSLHFISYLIGCLFTDNWQEAMKILKAQLPVFLIPMVFFSLNLKQNLLRYALKYFSFAVTLYSFLVLVYVFSLKFLNLGDFSYYNTFAIFYNKHTTYIGLFVTVSITYFVNIFFEHSAKIKKIILALLVLILFVTIYFLSVRIAILTLFLNINFIVFFKLKSKLKYLIIGVSSVLIIGLFSLPNFERRFEPSMTEIGEVDGLEFRQKHWESVLYTINHNSLLFGNGTGSNRELLYDQYKKHKLTSAYIDEYNTHNQFLEITLENGLLGLLLFLLMFGYIYYFQIIRRNILELSILNIFLLFFMTESLLVRQSGIMLFSILATLIMLNSNSKKT